MTGNSGTGTERQQGATGTGQVVPVTLETRKRRQKYTRWIFEMWAPKIKPPLPTHGVCASAAQAQPPVQSGSYLKLPAVAATEPHWSTDHRTARKRLGCY